MKFASFNPRLPGLCPEGAGRVRKHAGRDTAMNPALAIHICHDMHGKMLFSIRFFAGKGALP
ncbi:MAG: hypothetical protein Q4A11_06595 [Brachymonas sp.]|nr:hypothetical protein [Brachymonas sp.]